MTTSKHKKLIEKAKERNLLPYGDSLFDWVNSPLVEEFIDFVISETISLNPQARVTGKPYVGKLFQLKKGKVYVHAHNIRARSEWVQRERFIPDVAIILDEKGRYLCVLGNSGTPYWLKRSYFHKEVVRTTPEPAQPSD